ncbi:MAG TPA: hypothetical protein VNN79_05985 [Actinomycetota bacterium]|nr:hypothetical protein [Actinomycetota bacterium]
MSEEFKFPKLVIHEEYEEEGKKFSRSITSPVCDFCFDERVTWSYVCEDFALLTSVGPWGSSNGWATCDTCSELIERYEWVLLALRIMHSWEALGAPWDDDKWEDAWMVSRGFRDNYTPGREAFG